MTIHMPDPVLEAISTKTVGFMGESLTALLLELEFGSKGLRVLKLGDERVEWDLEVDRAPEGIPFTRQSVIQVKSRSKDSSYWTYPTREDFLATKKKAEELGLDLWYSFVHYRYNHGHLLFGAYLVPASDINEEDFTMRREFGKDVEMLKINDMRDRARLRFRSRKMHIEDEYATESRTDGEDVSEDDAPVSVAEDQTGDWGEDMAAFMLASEYKPQDMEVTYTGRGDCPFDLFVVHAYDGTPFSRQAAISVKAISANNSSMKLSFEEMSEMREALDAWGIHYWLVILQYYYHESALGFGMYLIDADALDRDDFVDPLESQQRSDRLNVVRARNKAAVRLWTRETTFGE